MKRFFHDLWQDLQSRPLETQLRRLRWLVLPAALLWSVFHLVVDTAVIRQETLEWYWWIELLFYAVTGGFAAWVGVTIIAKEADLRGTGVADRVMAAGLMVLAPLVVVFTLLVLGRLWITFICYHLLICLVLPLVDSLVRRRIPFREHLRLLGTRAPRGNPAPWCESPSRIGLICSWPDPVDLSDSAAKAGVEIANVVRTATAAPARWFNLRIRCPPFVVSRHSH